MKRMETGLPGVCLLEPIVYGDARGYSMETYTCSALAELGIDTVFVQDNESFTARRGTVRGVHFQMAPMAQAKLVRVVRGAVMDVAVDLRRGSPTYLQWRSVELSEENKRMLYVPRGFGHGFKTLTDNVIFCYKLDNPYSPAHDRSVRFDDPALGISWGEVDASLLSKKDANAPLLAESDCNFVYE